MPPKQARPKVLNWASEIDDATLDQAEMTARLPFVHGHVALMADAHVGKGSTVGSVIATQGAIVPSCVGVDIGCGMIAVETSLNASQLPDDLGALLAGVEQVVPAGVGKGHMTANLDRQLDWSALDFSMKEIQTAGEQLGSLGSGNHFVEVCLDERNVVWVMLHSGSRGIGNQLATKHIEKAKKLMKQYFITLEDPDLAYLVQGTSEFNAYIRAMHWAQDYAMVNRSIMMDAVLGELTALVPECQELQRINVHHNYTQQENHHGKNLWVTRKGAVKAAAGDLGIIPGSMGTGSFIVRGKGNPASFNSSSHGAGRRLSRSAARKQFTAADMATQMAGKTWLADKADDLVDEIPASYKDINVVMEDQSDLVDVLHKLTQVLNFKGVS